MATNPNNQNNFLAGDQYSVDKSGQPPAGQGSSTTPASFGGPTPSGQTPPPSINPQVVYTDPSGKGYDPNQLSQAWSNGSVTDPRVRDILSQYNLTPGQTNPAYSPSTTPPTSPSGGLGALGAGAAALAPSAIPNPTASNTSNLSGSGQSQDLVNLLMQRAGQSLAVDPMTDPILRPQLDAANAAAQRANRSYLSESAEKMGPNSNTDATARSLAENTAQGQSQLAATLGQNELTARRSEIQNALAESGSMLTSQQQLSLQQELGLIDAQLRGQQLQTNQDQFTAQLGLNAEQAANYWDAIRSGLI